jgi:hypothetical protein
LSLEGENKILFFKSNIIFCEVIFNLLFISLISIFPKASNIKFFSFNVALSNSIIKLFDLIKIIPFPFIFKILDFLKYSKLSALISKFLSNETAFPSVALIKSPLLEISRCFSLKVK